MKKYLKIIIALSPIISASAIALKFKPPKKEVFNFVKPLKESEQEVKEKEEESLISNDTQNLLNDIKNDFVKLRAGKATNFIVKAGRDLSEWRQQEYVDPNILIKKLSESSYASQKLDQSVEEALLSSHLEIEDIPQENRSIDDYIRSFECARVISVDRYIEICRLILDDIDSFGECSAMTRREVIDLLIRYIIKGFDYFIDHRALDDFMIEQEKTLGEIGIFHDPNYSAEEFNENVNNHSKDVIDLVYSAKEDLKTLSYIGRIIRSFQKRGLGFAIIPSSKYFKRPRKAYEYLVEHADEWRGSSEVSAVVITDMCVGIYFERI